MYTKNGNTRYYLKVNGNNRASSTTSLAWSQAFFFERQSDGSYAMYTKEGSAKYYFKICGDNQATSQTSVGGWCEKFKFSQRFSDGSYGLYSTPKSSTTKYDNTPTRSAHASTTSMHRIAGTDAWH